MSKVLEQLLSLKDSKAISEAAEKLSSEEVQELLKHIETQGFEEKLSSVANSLDFLKRALPHFQSLYEAYEKELYLLEECINELPLFPIPSSLLASLCDQLVAIFKKIATLNQFLTEILQLTWLSNNPETIALYSELKGPFTHLMQKEETLSSLLMERLNSIYGATNEASVMEGLTALGISYTEDFKQLGAIFGLDLPEKNLVAALHDRLVGAGLATVADLKAQKIYTKEHLFSYLKERS